MSKRPFPRVSITFSEPSLTRQSEMVHTDLKSLVRRYQAAGGMPPPSHLQYGDVSELPQSRLEVFEILRQADEAFRDLPFKVRQAINHDPRLLEQWIISNPQLAAEYGLFKPVDTPASPPSPSSSGTDEGKEGEPA